MRPTQTKFQTLQQQNYQPKLGNHPIKIYNFSIKKRIVFSFKQKQRFYVKFIENERTFKTIKLIVKLRKQRKADMELIAKQNSIIKNQQNLLYQNLLSKYNSIQSQTCKQKSKKNTKVNIKEALQCKQCKTHAFRHIQDQFQGLRVQKLEQQRKQLRKQIHNLVFKCENYKSEIKSLNQKYEKQIIHNEKLIRLLYPQQLQEKYSKPNSEDFQYHKNSSMKNLHVGSQRQKHQNKQSFKDSFKDSCKQSIIDIYNATTKLQKKNNENKCNFNNKGKNSSIDFEWCQNNNIKKYLQQINREKKQEIDQIQSLLRYS